MEKRLISEFKIGDQIVFEFIAHEHITARCVGEDGDYKLFQYKYASDTRNYKIAKTAESERVFNYWWIRSQNVIRCD